MFGVIRKRKKFGELAHGCVIKRESIATKSYAVIFNDAFVLVMSPPSKISAGKIRVPGRLLD